MMGGILTLQWQKASDTEVLIVLYLSINVFDSFLPGKIFSLYLQSELKSRAENV